MFVINLHPSKYGFRRRGTKGLKSVTLIPRSETLRVIRHAPANVEI